tara:strand:- start:3727 stop:4944 length:1218 start_codon:yes stop_codon:yes gene_type:complete
MGTIANSNTRIFYATQAATIGAIGNISSPEEGWTNEASSPQTGAATLTHGVQSIGIDTNFNLEQAFELGQLSLYENIEDIPEIAVSMQKFLDGYSLLYHLGASYDGDGTVISTTNTSLSGRADTRADVRLVLNATTDEAVTTGDSGVAELYCSGMYMSSVSYTIPTDGTCTEDVSFVGNNKKWLTDDGDPDSDMVLINGAAGLDTNFGTIFGDDAPNYSTGHVLRREDVVTGSTAIQGYSTVMPSIIEGIVADSGTAIKSRMAVGAGILNTANAHIQSFNCSVDLGRESINQLGTKTPYSRYVTFPTEVTSAIEVIAIGGDNVDALENNRTNLINHEICVVLKDSTVMHLGKKNKVSSITYGGGDAGGGNASITYNFSNFNDLVVLHSGDPIRTGGTYWDDKFGV